MHYEYTLDSRTAADIWLGKETYAFYQAGLIRLRDLLQSWNQREATFWKEGYRAIMLTDTAPYRYAEYHTPQVSPTGSTARSSREPPMGSSRRFGGWPECPFPEVPTGDRGRPLG